MHPARPLPFAQAMRSGCGGASHCSTKQACTALPDCTTLDHAAQPLLQQVLTTTAAMTTAM